MSKKISLPDLEPREYQIPFFEAMDDGLLRAVLVWHRRCIAKGTLILMSNGSVKKIEDVAVGDRILSHDGTSVVEDEVVGSWSSGLKETVRSQVSGQLPILTTPDHKFANTFQGCTKKITWDPIAEINPNKMVLLYQGTKEGKVHEPKLAEWLGYMLTDGYVNAHQQPKFTNVNDEILKRVEELTKEVWDMNVIWRPKGNGYDLGMSSGATGSQIKNPIKRWFNQHGISGKGADRRLPKIVWDWDRETVGRFFAGVISGDGCIYLQKRSQIINGKEISPCVEIKISCGMSKNMADDMYWLLRKHSFLCSPVANDKRHTNWMVRIWNRKSVKDLLSFGRIYGKEEKRVAALASYQCKRTRSVWNSCHRAHIKTVSSGIEETFDLEIKTNNNFFANGYLVHNSGKEIVCWNYMIREAACGRIGTYCYFFPTSRLGRRILWDGANKDGKRFVDYIPKELVVGKPNSVEMKIELINGSVIQIMGTDTILNVGINPIGCIFSEFSLQDPKSWTYIRPILRENEGWAIFNGTPRGKNHFFDLYQMAKDNPDWFCQRLGIADTGVLTEADMDIERREGMSENMIQQEYKCNFDQGSDGSFYAKYLSQAELEERVTNVPYDPYTTVDTYWDLGVSDSTTIIFAQNVGQEIHIIDSYTNEGEGLDHYARVIEQKAKDGLWKYGRHCAPHDIQVRELGHGARTRLQMARDLGLDFEVVPNLSINEGIEMARGMWHKLWIDRKKNTYLIKCLENYHRTYNERLNVYSDKPTHDWSSHFCDSFRYMGVMQNKSRRSAMTENQANDFERMYARKY